MSRDPFASPNNDAESALSDDDLDGVVGGTGTPCPLHSGQFIGHQAEDDRGIYYTCNGTTRQTASGGGTRTPILGG
jgi:hypothetical protein